MKPELLQPTRHENPQPATPAIKGEPWKLVGGKMTYLVILHGGPADGMKTIASEITKSLIFAGHRYALTSGGAFEYSPAE